jgi:hypothetical protein
MKTKSWFDKLTIKRKIPSISFASFLGLLFSLWLGFFSHFKYTLEELVPSLQVDLKQAFAGENVPSDFQKPSAGWVELENDTVYIENDSASRGDSLWVNISFHNHVQIAGFMAVVYYLRPSDTLWLRPVTQLGTYGSPPETTIFIENKKTDRSYQQHELPDTLAWGIWISRTVNNHIDTIKVIGSKYESPLNIQPGNGAVMRLRFVMTYSAPDTASISFGLLTIDPELSPNWLPEWDDADGLTFYRAKIKTGTIKLKGGGPPQNQCPGFTAPTQSEFEVNEGATLTFPVTATDPNGDSLTLSMDPLPSGYDYSFPTTKGKGSVAQTFTFKPKFTQGPDTIYATFKAEDKLGCSTTKTVSIKIIETAQDIIIVSSDEGGIPGSHEKMVPIIITNSIPIYGFQFTLRWDYTKVDIDSFVPADAISGFTMYTNLGDSLGKVTVLVFGLASQTIPAGMETVLYAAFSVDEHAPPVEVPLQLENAREATNPGDPSQLLGMVDGKFTIDMFGDANIDRSVDIADVVSVIAFILGKIDFTSRQFMAADVVPNDTMNVADLVGIINIILGRWSGPSPSSYLGPMATVRLDYDGLQAGTTGEVKVLADLEVPVAGAQIKIDYNSEQLSFEAPRLSDWSNKFIAEYKDDKQGKLIVVLYNLSNDPISPGEGKFLSLPVTVSPNSTDQIKLEIDEIVLADQNAVEIPVDYGKTSVPKAFELSQNYPNPFNPTTTIKYSLSSVGDGAETLPTTLRIYNVLGEVVRTLVDEPKSPGVYHEVWDGKDDQGKEVASGIYFYRLKAGKFSETKKMVLLK